MSQTYSPDTPPTSRIRVLLFLAWAALSAGAVAFVFGLTANAPYADEWEFVPVLLGEEPVGPWLWQQHNEHRLPLPRAVYYPLFQVTHDFRAGCLLQVLGLSALSLALMAFAARLRGRPDWPDVFFPVSLLHIGHWENFIMGYQLCFVLFAALTAGLVMVALQTTRETVFRSGVWGGVLLLLLAMTGGPGIVVVVPVALWLVYLAAILWRQGQSGRAVMVFGLAALSVSYPAVYFVGYERPPHHPPLSRDPIAVLSVTGEVLATAGGIGMANLWQPVFLGELALGAATIALLFRSNRTDRTSALGLVAVAAGVFGVALAIGLGRAAIGPNMGLWSRYSLLAWPLLGAAYLVWVRAGRKWVPVALCLVTVLAFPRNTGKGMQEGNYVRSLYNQIEADARHGLSAEEIVARDFPNTTNEGQEDRALRAIPLLRAAHVGIFAPGGSAGEAALWWLLTGVGTAVILPLTLRWLWHLGKAVMVERARELFRLQHERFEEQLLKATSATGLPRGLRWVKCLITGDAVLARDRTSGGIVALVPVRIDFEPEPGSDMEENPAAREPRPATAVFTFHRGTWETAGRVVFNHTPEQTVAAFASQFRVIHHGHH
jgi:hypothetical protein